MDRRDDGVAGATAGRWAGKCVRTTMSGRDGGRTMTGTMGVTTGSITLGGCVRASRFRRTVRRRVRGP